MRLREIEKRILEINDILSDETGNNVLSHRVVMPGSNVALDNSKSLLIKEIEQHETERRFILDRREGLPWKILWNIVVPIIVSIITVYFLKKFGLG